MKTRAFCFVAVTAVALSLSGCESGKSNVVQDDGGPAAEQEVRAETSAQEAAPDGEEQPIVPDQAEEDVVEKNEPHTDQVPGALERMRQWPGLGDAVTEVVMSSPKGRIHGHDARRIDIAVDDEKGTARVDFVMLKNFKLHGDRTVACSRADGRWSCRDET